MSARRREWRVVIGVLASIIMLVTPCDAQVVSSTASPMMAMTLDGSAKSSRNDLSPAEAARIIALYATPFLGEPGKLDETTTHDTKSGHHFPTVHFVFSAAARMQPSGAETRLARQLQRLNAHIFVEATDANGQPLTTRAGVEILELLPNTLEYTKASTDSSSVKSAAATAVSRTLMEDAIGQAGKRLKPVLAEFKKIFHHPSAPTQVSYISDEHEFGWTWYEHPDQTLEGLHRATVLLEVAPDVRYLKVRIDLTSDWMHHGSWRRQFESIIDLGG